jgi:hypothetical protein
LRNAERVAEASGLRVNDEVREKRGSGELGRDGRVVEKGSQEA